MIAGQVSVRRDSLSFLLELIVLVLYSNRQLQTPLGRLDQLMQDGEWQNVMDTIAEVCPQHMGCVTCHCMGTTFQAPHHVTTAHLTTPRHTTPHRTTPYHTMPYHNAPHHTRECNAA